MAPSLSSIVVLALCVILSPCVSAGDDCLAHSGKGLQKCNKGFCCGDCSSRHCCSDLLSRFDEDDQEQCFSTVHMHPDPTAVIGVFFLVLISLLIIIFCCFCPFCYLYKRFHQRRSEVAITTHETVVSSNPQRYPQHLTAVRGPSQSYEGVPYHSVPMQPGYPAQPVLTVPSHGQPFISGPPPSYQEAISHDYTPPLMPYKQAVFSPGQSACPLMPPAQPAYNPDFVTPPVN
ncbi:protein shisa-5-like [Archocentrus centrarchus]|uniref:protein shisa-5-like n=1 Tax=Archocentrus centrarchus TaxID=63155 RepID=UPI0011EA12FB|nr:protein shisa-5-like [Archocentrus centrarchus]